MQNRPNQNILWVAYDVCFVIGCPTPKLDLDWYYNELNEDAKITDMRHDGETWQPITKRVDDREGNTKLGHRHWWHGVPSGYTGEHTEYIINPNMARIAAEYELQEVEKIGREDTGSYGSRNPSREATFLIHLAELRHDELIE